MGAMFALKTEILLLLKAKKLLKQVGLMCELKTRPTFYRFRYSNITPGPNSYRDFCETGPWHFVFYISFLEFE